MSGNPGADAPVRELLDPRQWIREASDMLRRRKSAIEIQRKRADREELAKLLDLIQRAEVILAQAATPAEPCAGLVKVNPDSADVIRGCMANLSSANPVAPLVCAASLAATLFEPGPMAKLDMDLAGRIKVQIWRRAKR